MAMKLTDAEVIAAIRECWAMTGFDDLNQAAHLPTVGEMDIYRAGYASRVAAAEPVAWRYRLVESTDPDDDRWYLSRSSPNEGGHKFIVEPLYASPPAPQGAEPVDKSLNSQSQSVDKTSNSQGDTIGAPSDTAARHETSLLSEIARVLNMHCAENVSNTPDLILARFLTESLAAFDSATHHREKWYGVHHSPGGVTTLAAEPGERRPNEATEVEAAESGAREPTCEELAPGCIGFTNGCHCAACMGAAPPAAPPAETAAPDAEDAARLYHELLYAVASKYPGETRHQTALRYIIEREHRASSGPDAARSKPEPK